jgi:hypothetical protein
MEIVKKNQSCFHISFYTDCFVGSINADLHKLAVLLIFVSIPKYPPICICPGEKTWVKILRKRFPIRQYILQWKIYVYDISTHSHISD